MQKFSLEIRPVFEYNASKDEKTVKNLELSSSDENIKTLKKICNYQGDFETELFSNIIVNYDSKQKSDAVNIALHDLKDKSSYLCSHLFEKYKQGKKEDDEKLWMDFTVPLLDKIVSLKDRNGDSVQIAAYPFINKTNWYFYFYLPEHVLEECFGDEKDMFMMCPHAGFKLIEIGDKNMYDYALMDYYTDMAIDGDPKNGYLKDLNRFYISVG